MANTQKPMLTVAAGTRPGSCSACEATVFWVFTDQRQLVPVNCDVEGGLRPVRYPGKEPGDAARGAGKGIMHDCPNAGQHRRS